MVNAANIMTFVAKDHREGKNRVRVVIGDKYPKCPLGLSRCVHVAVCALLGLPISRLRVVIHSANMHRCSLTDRDSFGTRHGRNRSEQVVDEEWFVEASVRT